MSKGRIRLSERVAARPEVVFAVLTDLERSPEWDPRVTQVKQMTRGPLRTGVILRGILAMGDETYHLDDEVTDYDPPWRFGLRSVQGGGDAISYSLSEEADQTTRLDVTLFYDLPDPPPALGFDDEAVQRQVREGLQQSLRRLKDLVEREVGRST